ncbi:hypothetical protein ACF3NA_04005 [Alkanindiges sp. WGS2144]|uniref:hypothetical protein n=1 Tax=Alkanindiges sp. WGS2144 TaxID=3366808 RepID=UPI003751F5A5
MSEPLRLSVTMLDTYVYGMANEDISSEQLAYELFAKKKPSPAMRVGTAFHRMLESADALDTVQRKNGYEFILPKDLSGTIELGSLREQKYEWSIFDDLILVGKIDAETPLKVIDHKLTYRFDHDRYMDSMQWRAYLAMRDKPHFTYQVFEHSGLPEVPNLLDHYPVFIKDYHKLDQYAYAGMHDDVKDVAHDLAAFARLWLPIIQGMQFHDTPSKESS